MLFGVIISASYSLYREKRRKNEEEERYQGAELSTIGTRPETKDERESVWKKDEYVVDSFDFSRNSLSWRSLSHDKICDLVQRNTATMNIVMSETWQKTTRIVCLRGHTWIANNHAVPELKDPHKCIVFKGNVSSTLTSGCTFYLDERDLKRYPERDICVFKIRHLPPCSDIVELFHSKRLNNGRYNATYVGTSKTLEAVRNRVAHLSLRYSAMPNGVTIPHWVGSPEFLTEKGDCGTVLVAMTDFGPTILGIHQNLDKKNKLTGAVSLDIQFVSSIVDDDEITDGYCMINEHTDCTKQVGDVHIKATPRFVRGSGKVYGSLEGQRFVPRSQVQHTLLYDKMCELGHKCEHYPPVMIGWEPWHLNIKKQVEADAYVSESELVEIGKQLTSEWLSMVSDEDKAEICVYDIGTALNGIPGLRFVDSINRKSSAGFPWCHTKKGLLTYLESDEVWQDPVDIDESVKKRIEERLTSYLDGRRSHPIFQASLKDEALPLKKVKAKKTRVFMGAPVDFTLLMRMYTLSFVRVAQRNKFVFESAPGVEAQCIEWEHLRDYLTKFGEERMIFGDFSGFDSTMRAQFLLTAFDCIIDFCSTCGYSKEEVRVLKCIAEDVTFPTVNFHGDLVEFFGKNPSGQALTVTINSIVNCLYMRYCYKKLNPAKEISSFRENVALLTYGDDNGMGVSEKVPWFNHSSVSKILESINVVYTMADKESETRPYIHIDEASFLKRIWRFDEDLNHFVCPLDEASIKKSLMIGLKSKAVTAEEQAVSLMLSALGEYFWYGKDTFNYWRKIFMKWRDDLELHEWGPQFDTWEIYRDKYEERSRLYGLEYQDGDEHRCTICGNVCDVMHRENDFVFFCFMCQGARDLFDSFVARHGPIEYYELVDGMCDRCDKEELCVRYSNSFSLELCRTCNFAALRGSR